MTSSTDAGPAAKIEMLYLHLKDGRWLLVIVSDGKSLEFEAPASIIRGMLSEAAMALTS